MSNQTDEVAQVSAVDVDFSTEGQIRASYSALNTHRSCPQRWNYGTLRRLEPAPDQDAKAELYFGLWWHALRAADSIDRGRAKGCIVEVPATLRVGYGDDELEIATDGPQVAETVRAEAASWWHKREAWETEEWAARLGEGLPERLAYVNARWGEEYAAELEDEMPLAVELGWWRELPLGDGLPTLALVGYVDEVVFDRRRGLVMVRDHKTSKQLAPTTVAEDMMDSQLQLYAWGAGPRVAGWGYGKIAAVGYDRVRSKRPSQPWVTQSGSLSKQVTDFDLWTYLNFAAGPDGLGVPYPGRAKDGSQAGLYQADPALVDHLANPAYRTAWFQRSLAPLNPNLVRAHLQAAADSAADMIRTRARAAKTGEAPRSLGAHCRWCDFAKLCRAEMVGGPYGEYVLADYGLRQRPT